MPDRLPDWNDTLAGDFAELATDLRALHEDFGTRAFRVFLVWLRWPGNVRGAGVPQLAREFELRPIPRVRDTKRFQFEFLATGYRHNGDLTVDEIPIVDSDGREITANLLTGMDEGPIPPDVDFFYELRPMHPNHETFRMTLSSEPMRSNERLEWSVDLMHRDPGSPNEGVTAATASGVTW